VSVWFNLKSLVEEIPDRGYFRQEDGELPLFEVWLLAEDGRTIASSSGAILSRALRPIGAMGMLCAPSRRLILHIHDPLEGDSFLAVSDAPADDQWAEAAIEQLKGRLTRERANVSPAR
jgi:hypothetical protein